MPSSETQSLYFPHVGFKTCRSGASLQGPFALRSRDFFICGVVIGLAFANFWYPHIEPLVGVIEAFTVYAAVAVTHTCMAAVEAPKIEVLHESALYRPALQPWNNTGDLT